MRPDPRLYFAELRDPRRETRNKLHQLHDILMMVLCAVLSGVEDWVGMEAFVEEKEAWLRGFLDLPNGLPAHDTLSDVLGRIDRETFAEMFSRWVQAALPVLAGEQGCRDGKTLRGTASLGAVETGFGGNQPRHCFAAPGDKDFLAVFDPIEQSAEFVLGFKGPDFTHDVLQSIV